MKKRLLFIFMALVTTSVTWAKWGDVFTADNLKYKVTSENPNLVTLMGYDRIQPSGDFKIPATVNFNDANYTVTVIEDQAFKTCTSLTAVTIPSSIKSIGWSIFSGCSRIASVTFAEGTQLKDINVWAFYGCSNLTSITIPASVTSISQGAFQECTKLTSVYFANGSQLTSIGREAFMDCWKLAAITFPASLTTIYANAFSGCDNLTSITIPANVTKIGETAFFGCNIKAFNVAAGNQYFKSVDGVLFDKDMTTLITYPLDNAATNYTIPDNVTTIIDNAFFACNTLATVTIPASVTNIGGKAFFRCNNLTDIFCYANPASLTWGTGVYNFKPNKETLCHVTGDVAAWEQKFADINVTFVSDEQTFEPCDVNRDGVVDTQDVLEIYNYMQNH